MAHDDFLYTRQENPRPQFVYDLRASLQEEEMRLRRPPRLSWRIARVAAAFILASTLILAVSPETRAFVLQALGLDQWISINEDMAQEIIPFAVPELIPDGFVRSVEWGDALENGDMIVGPVGERIMGFVRWEHSKTNCTILMSIFEDPTTAEVRHQAMARNRDLAQRYNWIEVFTFGDAEAVWRLQSMPGSESDMMVIEWTTANQIRHHIESSTACIDKDTLIRMAQSAQ